MRILETYCGDQITPTIRRAIAIAVNDSDSVQFDFNGVTVAVEASSDSDLIYRDWQRAMSGYLGEKPTIGPHPKRELSDEELTRDAEIQADNDARRAKRDAEASQLRERQSLALRGALGNAGTIRLRDAAAWASFVAANQEPYGARVVRYADEWARLMQVRIDNGETIAECAEELSRLADDDGITGFMYVAAVSILARCWAHGDELKAWHESPKTRVA